MKTMTRTPLACALFALSTPALASNGQSVQVVAETRDYSDGYGELNTIVAELAVKQGSTTIVIEPRWGERVISSASWSAAGIGATLYQRFSPGLYTTTRIAAAQNEPVFAELNAAQDVTVRVARSVTATFGARYSRYYGKRDVYFLSSGVRYYFKRGAIAYRLSHIDPDHKNPIWAHLVQVTMNDGAGNGKTQLWLGAGGNALEDAVFVDHATGDDYSVYLRRYQPITDKIDLIGNLGIASYDRPGGRITAPTFGVGLRLALDR